MRIYAQDPESGRKFSGVASDLDEDTIDGFFNSFNLSDEETRSWIGHLDISADAKSILYKIAKMTIRAGQFIIKIGRKILEIVSLLFREFPKAAFLSIFCAVVGFLVVGFAVGAWQDIKDKNMKRRMQEEMVNFEKLRTA